MFFMNSRLSLGNRPRIVIMRRETLCRANLDTMITDAALEAVNLPVLVLLADNNGIGRAPFAAHAAKYAFMYVVFNFSPGNRSVFPLYFGIHTGGRPLDQVHGYCFRHGEYFHFDDSSPFRATDTRVQSKNDIRHICQFRALQYLDHCRNITEGGDAHPESLQKF